VLPFTDKWFGEARVDTGHVEHGTFAHVKLTASDYSSEVNSYGLVRSPWNSLRDDQFARYFGAGSALVVAPTIFISQDDMPTCEIIYEVVNSKKSLFDLTAALAGNAHQPVHMYTGGQSGTRNMAERLAALGIPRTEMHDDMYNFGYYFFFSNVKSLWRYHLFECPASCSSDTPQDQCGCHCDAETILASDYKAALLDSWEAKFSTLHLNGTQMLKEMLDLMCEYSKAGGMLQGDSGTSGSASDPFFWIIHGSTERLTQLMRLQDRVDSVSWSPFLFDSNIHPFTTSCSGHHEHDSLVFGAVDGYEFTNREYFEYLNPKKASLPYVYDNFQWKHCEALGYDIADRKWWNGTQVH